MNDLVQEFTRNVRNRKLSENTIDAYKRDLERFNDFLHSREENLKEIDELTIMAYVQSLKKLGKADSSIIRNIISIRNFYKYLVLKGIIDKNPADNYDIPKNKRQLPQILSIEEVDRLLNTPDISSKKGLRDKTMLEVMYATGIKVTELLDLKSFDVNTKLGFIRCHGSNNKERIIPIGSYAINCLKEYVKCREEINFLNSDLLFLNLKGSKMTRQGFWKIVKEYAKDAGIDKNLNLYTLRHSFAVHLLQNGADIKSVQELLGHSDMSSTQVYSMISKKNKLAQVYLKAHPRA